MAIPPEAKRRLEEEPRVAHFGTCADGRPHVAPVWFRYAGHEEEKEVDGDEIEGHDGDSEKRNSTDDRLEIVTTGRKLENVRDNPRVALSIQADEGGEPRWALTLLGTATVVDDEERSAAARRRIHERYDADPDAYEENVLVRIEIGTANYRTY
ncbi:pyridoxamine 5'-phosphate oxidase [Halobiforma lacisalsi AJ5]|uniref:Pyridoxamine 5'-phosphate oxidase n=1 Tax=Natronobacterium lacisalsi AJ5 TaxID=358396 RepID=M0L5V7_NATLA|nr:pyridoxamine 5'-phosphate oxidase family protein [Halobiforma lacisalsi]APW96350.1 pyridoxamine 5'-phosphate oxidase [Halobiforma lacisalsi AJ5]EMA27375.1 pyridoxamine 5'-phosphate oxidase-related FMN- binding protein [Halobiforma lacisalsi AJ5]